LALVENDGVSNEATERGMYTELLLTCSVSAPALSDARANRSEGVGVTEEEEEKGTVYLTVDVVHGGYAGRWNWVVEPPPGDERRVVIHNSAGVVEEESHVGHSVELVVKVE